jgi:dethiobiotin synthetase
MIAASILVKYRSQLPLVYWKPVQTGFPEDDDTREVRILSGCSHQEIFDEGIRLPDPVSPHLAAKMAGTSIDFQGLVDTSLRISSTCAVVIEGAGGILVPLDDQHLMIDLIASFRLPVLIVSRTRLGTINHTLMTIEVLRARRLSPQGIVLVGSPDKETRKTIEQYGNVAVIGEMPWFDNPHSESFISWSVHEFDLDCLLKEYLSS